MCQSAPSNFPRAAPDSPAACTRQSQVDEGGAENRLVDFRRHTRSSRPVRTVPRVDSKGHLCGARTFLRTHAAREKSEMAVQQGQGSRKDPRNHERARPVKGEPLLSFVLYPMKMHAASCAMTWRVDMLWCCALCFMEHAACPLGCMRHAACFQGRRHEHSMVQARPDRQAWPALLLANCDGQHAMGAQVAPRALG